MFQTSKDLESKSQKYEGNILCVGNRNSKKEEIIQLIKTQQVLKELESRSRFSKGGKSENWTFDSKDKIEFVEFSLFDYQYMFIPGKAEEPDFKINVFFFNNYNFTDLQQNLVLNIDLESTLFMMCLDVYSTDIVEEQRLWLEFQTKISKKLFQNNSNLQKQLQTLNKVRYINQDALVEKKFEQKDQSESDEQEASEIAKENSGIPLVLIVNHSYENCKLFTSDQKREQQVSFVLKELRTRFLKVGSAILRFHKKEEQQKSILGYVMHILFQTEQDQEKVESDILIPIGFDSLEKIGKEYKSIDAENIQQLKPKSEENRKTKNQSVTNYDDIVNKIGKSNKKEGAQVKSLLNDIRNKRNDK